MGYYDIRQISPFLAANDKRPVHLIHPLVGKPSPINHCQHLSGIPPPGFVPHHYDTPGTFDKTSWFVTVFQTIRLSTFKSNRQATTNLSALWQTSEKLHTSKVKHTQTEQSERRENRYQRHNNKSRNEYSHIQSISTGYAKITRYSVSKNKA